ncbi:hypothetical protein FOZ61_008846, partial [Perkinsus olseni]
RVYVACDWMPENESKTDSGRVQPRDRLLYTVRAEDSPLTRGLAKLLTSKLNGKTPEEVLAVDGEELVEHFGLAHSLTPQRTNGFVSMIRHMQRQADEKRRERQRHLRGRKRRLSHSPAVDPVQRGTSLFLPLLMAAFGRDVGINSKPPTALDFERANTDQYQKPEVTVSKALRALFSAAGDLIFHPDYTFDIDIVLRGCKISVDGLTFSSPVFVPDMVMIYNMPISYNGTSLTNAVESCSNAKIKISDFDVPLTCYYYKGFTTWDDIHTFWGETPGNFVYRRR